ncbi:MAG: cupin domain-containing protein [Bacteroidales bacterium]|nr:cupin domain-containing protein [Bacteroidales bacterium]
MEIRNLNNSPKVPFNLEAFILHAEQRIEIIHITIKSGESLDKHKNPFDVIFFVISGTGILSIDNEDFKLSQNDTIKITSEKNRGWLNDSNSDLQLLVVKLL